MIGSVLVLGHTGFVGANVVEHLRAILGYKISGLSLSSGTDLRDPAILLDMLNQLKPDYIINCAAHVGSLNYVTENAGSVISDNTRMIVALYEAVSAYRQSVVVINPVANCGYPGDSVLYLEDDWQSGPVHQSVLSYGSTRRLLIAFADCFSMQFGIKSINLFAPNMYGEYDSPDPNKAHALNALVAKFVKAEARGERAIEIWGTGVAVREWLYAKDFARIIELILAGSERYLTLSSPVNIAQNSGLSIGELAVLINSKFDNRFDLIFDPSKPDGAPRKVMDNTRFNTLFPGFSFEDFASGIGKTVAYYRSIFPY